MARAVWFETRACMESVTAHTRESVESEPARRSTATRVCRSTPSPSPLPSLAQRRAPRSDQLRVRGHALLRHPRAPVDAVPGSQPRHGRAAQVFKEVLDSTAHRLPSGDVRVRVEVS